MPSLSSVPMHRKKGLRPLNPGVFQEVTVTASKHSGQHARRALNAVTSRPSALPPVPYNEYNSCSETAQHE